MANPLTSRIARLFRDQAKPTSLKALHRQGYRNVPVLDVSELEGLVGRAIENVILETFDDPGRGIQLAQTAQVEFLRLLGNQGAIHRATQDLRKEKSTLEQNLDTLRTALTEARQHLAEQVEARDGEALEQFRAELGQAIDDVLARVRATYGDRAELDPALEKIRQSLSDSAFALLVKALKKTRPAAEEHRAGTEVEVLERRIRKLNASLSEAHEMLERLQSERDESDQGVASVYRDVQGLTGREEHYEQRRKLLKEVFQLNLEIRDQIGALDSPSGTGNGPAPSPTE